MVVGDEPAEWGGLDDEDEAAPLMRPSRAREGDGAPMPPCAAARGRATKGECGPPTRCAPSGIASPAP